MKSYVVTDLHGSLSGFEEFLRQAGLQASALRRQDLAYLFAYLVCRNRADTFPTEIVMSSADMAHSSSLREEQRAILALPEEASVLRDKSHFVTYLRWNNGGLMRMEMTFRDASSISLIKVEYLTQFTKAPFRPKSM